MPAIRVSGTPITSPLARRLFLTWPLQGCRAVKGQYGNLTEKLFQQSFSLTVRDKTYFKLKHGNGSDG